MATRTGWRKAPRGWKIEGQRLDTILVGAGFDIIGGTPLFRLARHAMAGKIFERLGAAGILVRPFANRPEWLRFGLSHQDEDLERLTAALGKD